MIAQNNLYDAVSSKGRLGDSELRVVDGQTSHVNPEEAAIIDRWGPLGERLVERVGSGNINPETGLPEYEIFSLAFVTAASAAIGAASSLYGMWSGSAAQTEADEAQLKEIGAQKSALGEDMSKAGGVVRDAYTGITEDFSDKIGQLTKGVGGAFGDVYGQVEKSMKKTGGLAVGAVQDIATDAGAALEDQFGLNLESLVSEAGQGVSNLFADYTQRQDQMWEDYNQMTLQEESLQRAIDSSWG